MELRKESKFWGSSRIIIFSFLGIIVVGTFLLVMPFAVTGEKLSFIDALFTATSATCVTGLVVVDTGSKFTLFGQIVILFLIQVGGLGIMTFSTFFIFLIAGKFSIADRDVIQDTMTQSPIRNIAGLLKTIFLFTVLIELAGAISLATVFAEKNPIGKSLYLGLFHSVSAFCNAGFGLYSDSFISYQGNVRVNLTIIFLIVSGGVGFIVMREIQTRFMKRKGEQKFRFSFHSKIVLTISAILIGAGFLLFFSFEYNNILKNAVLSDKLLISLFQSVTCRTAGFNTIDTSLLTNPTLFFMIILMFIGASPGSCGGGIKTTTAGVVIAMLAARFRNREDVNISYRRIPDTIISKAISVTFFSGAVVLLMVILLMITELSGISHQQSRGFFLEYLFEVISAFGTVGLSTGATATLSALGKLIIIVTMFVGRIGPLTLALAIAKKESPKFKYAQEKLLIG